MKAAVYEGPGALILQDMPRPSPGPGEALLKIRTCGICHTDVAIAEGRYFPRHKPPLILGHELAGVVAETAADVFAVEPGDRAIVYQCLTCGQCDRCREERGNLCREIRTLGLDIDGGYAEYIKIPAANLIKLPEGISFAEGSIIADALSTAYHAVSRLNLEKGETVAVFGSGVLGLNAVQVASRIFGAKVIALDTEEWKLRLAESKGAWKTLKVDGGADSVKALKALAGEPDAAVEFIGAPETYKQAIDSVRRGGRVILVGAATKPAALEPLRMFKDEVNVSGSYASLQSEVRTLVDLVARKALAVKDMVTHTFPLEKINEAIDLLAARRERALRGVIRLD